MLSRNLLLPISVALLAGLTVLTLASAGCSQNQPPLAALEKAQTLTLYSIDGRDYTESKVEKPKTDETFQGYPVMGKVEIKDAAKRKELIAALKKGIEQKDIHMNKCFWPRHAIRVVEDGKNIDYVICFECHQIEIKAGDTRKVIAVSDDPKATLNQFLKDANQKIVPDGKPGTSNE